MSGGKGEGGAESRWFTGRAAEAEAWTGAKTKSTAFSVVTNPFTTIIAKAPRNANAITELR